MLSRFLSCVFFLVAFTFGVQAQIYTPEGAEAMGDQWLVYHRGTHYLYHLYEKNGKLHGVYLATSKDGVHYTEVGPVVEKKDDATWLGSGAVWRAGDKFMMNFSEARDHQSISFAESDDLIHWNRLPDDYTILPDTTWYELNRWDCIWPMPDKEDGFLGYLSANPWRKSERHPNGLTYRSVGMVQSKDGVRWFAMPPPVFEWEDTPQLINTEVAAVALHDGKYYMIVQTWNDGKANYLGRTASGVYTFVADSPTGPFRPEMNAYHFLGNTHIRSSHFPRFYNCNGNLLINHFSFDRKLKAYLAPLKRAVFDQGSLHLGYWEGNDVMKGEAVEVELGDQSKTAGRNSKRQQVSIEAEGRIKLVALANEFDVDHGVILEGELDIHPHKNEVAEIGLYIRENEGSASAILLKTNGKSELGSMKIAADCFFVPDDFVDSGIAPYKRHTFRLLVRKYIMEFYLDDRLVQCYSIPQNATGEIGFVLNNGQGYVGKLRGWNMNFNQNNGSRE